MTPNDDILVDTNLRRKVMSIMNEFGRTGFRNKNYCKERYQSGVEIKGHTGNGVVQIRIPDAIVVTVETTMVRFPPYKQT